MLDNPRVVTSRGVIVDGVRGQVKTCLGTCLYLKVFTHDYRRLGWEEVWEAFSETYPDRWAVQVFPPREELVNGKNVYHLFVLPNAPTGMNIKRLHDG